MKIGRVGFPNDAINRVDEGFKFLLGDAQGGILGLDLAKHLVERLSKLADLIPLHDFSPNSIILVFGNHSGSLGKIQNRDGDDALETGRKQICEQNGEGQNQPQHTEVKAEKS